MLQHTKPTMKPRYQHYVNPPSPRGVVALTPSACLLTSMNIPSNPTVLSCLRMAKSSEAGVATGQRPYSGVSLTTNISPLLVVLPFICEGKKLQRKADYLYRITREADGRWQVMAYLEQDTGVVGPRASFDDAALPDWIRKDIALLSMVGRMDEIKSIGHRIGDTFWLISEKSKHLLKRREVIMAMGGDQLEAQFGPGQGRVFGEIK